MLNAFRHLRFSHHRPHVPRCRLRNVLNAFRHLRFSHQAEMSTKPYRRMLCSTPFGI